MNPLHSDYCHCECPATAYHVELREAVRRVAELHKELIHDGVPYCGVCVDHDSMGDEWQQYPCDTIRELHGDDQWDKISEVLRYLNDL